ncbi:MAG TPA: carboxypeptidase-like regulatory domain-containing protein, partial [Sediminibacterium sp.]|nr:carboxypeptidase-like regulatory domain-containing protein [Sediminibacterium sp.]
MKEMLLGLFFLAFTGITKAQVIVKGEVTDHRNRPLAGASVQVKGSYDGGITDSTGHFSFTTYEKGNQVITITLLGYKTIEQSLLLDQPQTTLVFVLKEEVTELKAVTVTAGSFEAGDRKKAATVLSSLDIVTTGGANADISAVVKTLPGAQQVGEQEGLFVRGGAGYEAKQFIDGTLV